MTKFKEFLGSAVGLLLSLYWAFGFAYGELRAYRDGGWTAIITPISAFYSIWYGFTWPYYVFSSSNPEPAVAREADEHDDIVYVRQLMRILGPVDNYYSARIGGATTTEESGTAADVCAATASIPTRFRHQLRSDVEVWLAWRERINQATVTVMNNPNGPIPHLADSDAWRAYDARFRGTPDWEGQRIALAQMDSIFDEMRAGVAKASLKRRREIHSQFESVAAIMQVRASEVRRCVPDK